ncbi:MAG TPA: hypothetical protein VGS41_18785, partial [Chthonomonadales bacterium]|nr:hypothetical protein [Chthonomonadales bacterium]
MSTRLGLRSFRALFTVLFTVLLAYVGSYVGEVLLKIPGFRVVPIPGYSIKVRVAMTVVGLLAGIWTGPKLGDLIVQAGKSL